MSEKIKEMIEEAESIAVLCHINADGDALGSAYGLKEVLLQMGKSAECFLEERPNRRIAFLAENAKVYGGEKCEFDLCIAVDTATKERLGARSIIFDSAKKTVCIDHHKSNPLYADVNLVKGSYCAAAEVIYEYLKDNGFEINEKAARLFYCGIMSDSGCLKYSSVTPSTVRCVADLMEYGFDHSELTRKLFDSYAPELIKLEGAVMNSIESYAAGKISLVETTSSLLKKYGVEDEDADNLVNIPRKSADAEIAIEVKERGGRIRASLRSNGAAEVDRIAEAFGGGGHIKAAGITFSDMTLKEAKEAVIREAEKELLRIGIK